MSAFTAPGGAPGPAMVIGLDDGVASAALGDRLAYTISLANSGHTTSGDLSITFTPPTGVQLAAAGEGAAISDGVARWSVSVDAGRTIKLTATAHVAELPEGAKGLAGVACVTDNGVPQLCATDIDQIPGRADIHSTMLAAKVSRPDHGWVPTAVAAGAGVALVALTLAAAWLLRRRRRSV